MLTTISELILAAADCVDRGPIFLNERLQADTWSFAKVVQSAARHARFLQECGIAHGERVGIVLPDAKDFMAGFFGTILAGAIPVPMPLPISPRTSVVYVQRCERIMASAGCSGVLLPRAMHPLLEGAARTCGCKLLAVEDVVRVDSADYHRSRPAPTDACFLQFTSGSTSDPKGVVVTHENLLANIKAITLDGLRLSEGVDRGVSWLPLFHDMGLVGFVVAPLLLRTEVVFIPTLAFLRRPSVWMQVVHEHRGSVTFGPNFALGLAAKHARNVENLDLSCLRALGCGAEPIDPKTLDAFVTCYARAGLPRRAIMPAYGLAEATLAVSFARNPDGYKTIQVDRRVYEEERRVQILAPDADGPPSGGMCLVGCGSAMPGHTIEIHSEAGELLPEGCVGEIVLGGPSCTPGYFGTGTEGSTRLVRTGDLGFLLDGEVYVSGRKKDVIIVNGRNLYPQAIEWEVGSIPGVRQGSVVAFGVRRRHSEGLVVLVEPSISDHQAVESAVRTRLWEAFNVSLEDVRVVERGAIPKTSSGKLQRAQARTLWETGQIGTRSDAAMQDA